MKTASLGGGDRLCYKWFLGTDIAYMCVRVDVGDPELCGHLCYAATLARSRDWPHNTGLTVNVLVTS